MLDNKDDRSYHSAMARASSKQANREKLLDQGVAMLMEHGYHGTGLTEILNAVRIPKGSFYNYFPSKEDFGAEIVRHYIEPFIRQLSGYMQRPELDALTALELYFTELIDQLEKREFRGGCLLGNLMGEIGDTSEICRAALTAAVCRYRDTLQAGLARAQQEGTVRTDKSAAAMADLLLNTWQGALLRMKIERSVAPLEECCGNLLGDYFRTPPARPGGMNPQAASSAGPQ